MKRPSGDQVDPIRAYDVRRRVGRNWLLRFSLAEHRWKSAALNLLGALIVAFTLAINMTRGYPIISLAAAALIAGGLYGQ